MATHGKDQDFWLDSSTPTLTDLTTYLVGAGVTFNRSIDLLDSTNAGDSSKEVVPGLKDATFDVEMEFDTTPVALVDGIYGQATTSTFEFYPAGNSSGKRKYTGECFLSNPGIDAPVGGLVSFKASFQVSGNVTASTVA